MQCASPVPLHLCLCRDLLVVDYHFSSLSSLPQASLASLASFVVGAGIPLLAAVFSEDQQIRLACVLVRSAFPFLDVLQELLKALGCQCVVRCIDYCV